MIANDPTGRQSAEYFNLYEQHQKDRDNLFAKQIKEIKDHGQSEAIKSRHKAEYKGLEDSQRQQMYNLAAAHKKEHEEYQKQRQFQRNNHKFQEQQQSQQTHEQTERERINIEQRLAEEKEARRQSLIEQTKNRWGLNKDKEKDRDRDKNKDR